MADDVTQSDAVPEDVPDPGAFDDDGFDPQDRDWSAWSNLWQVPAIVLSVGLIALALGVNLNRTPDSDWDGALDQVAELIGSGELVQSRERLVDVLEPNLDQATPMQRARFHALAADWIGRSQEARGDSNPENNRRIVEQYAKAVDLGLRLNAARIERWGNALVDLGELDDARDRIAELEALADTRDDSAEVTARRNRLLRRLVERSLREDDLPLRAMIDALARYRDDQRLAPSDRAWAIAREAELRIEAGAFRPAVDSLLVEMRRLEQAPGGLSGDEWGTLYGLLAEGFERLGRPEDATTYLDEAFRRFQNAVEARGRATMLRARMAIAAGDFETALADLETVVEEYPGTDVELPGLLARAEVSSILGRDDASLDDYRRLIELIPARPPYRGATMREVAQSLADRHDARLADGDLDRALEFAREAAGAFPAGSVPSGVLIRIASTTRQMGENVLAAGRRTLAQSMRRSAGGTIDPTSIPLDALPAQTRAQAADLLEQAADAFVQHARSIVAQPGQDDAWGASLWLAADSYDQAARPDEAITLFREYLAGRDTEDPRRAESTFRLAQAHEAVSEYEDAIARYRQVIDEHPRSPFGTRAHAALARALVSLGRDSEAEEVLLAVVEGRQGDIPLTPDAIDHRRAVIDLGRMYYRTGRERDAIERFNSVLLRDPEAADVPELKFWLADSHRGLAAGLSERLTDGLRMPPSERRTVVQQRDANLETSIVLFDDVVAAWAEQDPRTLDRRQRAMLRNAFLNRARAAYDLDRWDLAARLYDQAARRYADEHVSMQALVQIVNCFEQLGDQQRADVAHRNALLRLDQLPDEAFLAPDSLMDRAAWEQWLRSRPAGRIASATPGTPGSPTP